MAEPGKMASLLRCAWLLVPLAGCATAPAYTVPQVAATMPETYKEIGPWTPAAPADQAARGEWWTAFGDPLLDDLQGRLLKANPSLAAALARYDQARALFAQARADQYPQVGLQGGLSRSRESANRPGGEGLAVTGNDILAGGTISYELDLWGRVRNEVAAGKAEAQASAADLASARLSLQAQLADAYLSLRSLDAQAKVLDEAVTSYTRALALTKARHDGGVVSGIDVGQAQTQLQTALAAQSEVLGQRALYEHAIASLVGEPASNFSVAVAPSLPALPATPVSTPSVLLQRRPDVAAAERRAYEANRNIGVARAAYFPTITLGASGGFETTSLHQSLISTPSSFWSLGPAAAVALFDGGRRKAAVAQARGVFDESSANYRSTVLAAFQQVEDNLALLNRLAQEADQEQAALEAARRTEAFALTRYRQGAVTYLDVVTAQAASLDAQRAAIVLQARRLQASVDLVRALGGGWSTADLPKAAA
jgi:multidrug efflux system outer membrane protein